MLDDVLDEYVSVAGAARDYGVVLVGSLEELTLEVDEAATEARRAEMGPRWGPSGRRRRLERADRVEDPGPSVMIGP